jgi:hypothetical protein
MVTIGPAASFVHYGMTTPSDRRLTEGGLRRALPPEGGRHGRRIMCASMAAGVRQIYDLIRHPERTDRSLVVKFSRMFHLLR